MKNTLTQTNLEARLSQAHEDGYLLFPESSAEEKALYRRSLSGELCVPFPNMFAQAAYWDSLQNHKRRQALAIARTFCKKHPDKVLCDFSAATIYGLWVANSLVTKLHVVGRPKVHGQHSSLVVWHVVRGYKTVESNACRATSIEQTVFDCARHAAFPEALAIADSALRFGLTTKPKLRKFIALHCKGLHGRKQALWVIDCADGTSESGGESILRGLIIQKGYMPPTELQHQVVDPVTNRSYRGDQYWLLPDGREVIAELDGFGKYTDAEMLQGKNIADVLVAERQRESHITALGISVMRVLFKRINEPGYLEGLLDAFGIPKI